MTETKNNDERFPEVKPTKPGNDTAYIAPIIGKLGYDTRRPWLFGLGTSPNNGVDFHVFLSFDGLNFDDNDIDKIWNGGTADRVKKEVDSATAEIPAAVSAANSAVSAAESAVAASKVNSDAIVAQSEAISEAKSAMDSATAEIQQTAANAASDAAKIRADVAQVQSEVDTAKAANSASVEALKSDIDTAKQDLANVHDSLTKAQSAVEQNQKLINDSVAKITSDVSATKQDLATVHDSLTKAQAAAEQNQKAINDSIAEINANVDATNQDLAGVRKDLTKAQSDITANQKAIDDNVAQISDDITQDRKDIADVRQGLTKAQSDIIANQKAVNDNVAQINSDIEQDRKDIASAQQANADTVKQLDAYSKQAQEQGKTIKAVQDKQDGFSATLADVQGNVSQVSDKVSGLSASLKDAQDNVASVKAQADQLSATLTDHSKSIAILTASAKELSSTLEDADGRLSKVEQTAQTNSSTLSDVQGDLSQVKQNATKLVSTLKDAQGNISTLQQKADSVSAQLASAQGDIATLQTDVDGVKATLTSHDKSIHTLQADSKSLKDSMVNAQGDISTLRKTATDITSELEDHTGRLSKVEQSAAKQATTLSDLQGNLSQVEQKADSNTATISSINKNAMQDRGVITDTKTSFDSLTQLGTYSIKASGLPKMPEQHYGTLVVSGSAGSGWLSQQFVADTTGNVYTRVFSNNAWSAWKQGGSQDAINQVKQTADSNSATIRNVQGDVSTLKQTATGIKSTLASHEGDIHTLQADSKSLKDSMTNAQGDISTLQKSATSLDSEMKDHAGRLSKVEQNAATQATTLSDLQGNLTQVKQQADGLVTTLKDAQGSITQIQQKADGTLAQLKSAQGDIASLQTNITGIKATLVSHEGDIHTLQADSRMLKDDMADAQGNISSLKKSATDLTSEMSSQDGRLSKVEQTAKEHTSTISDLGDKLSNMQIGGRNLLVGTSDDERSGKAYAFAEYQISGGLQPGTTYTLSGWARVDQTAMDNQQHVFVCAYTSDWSWSGWLNIDGSLTEKYNTVTFTTPSGKPFNPTVSVYLSHPNGDSSKDPISGMGYISKLKLEKGNVATDWTPAPEDMATVTQVKQTADGIETTLKSAQGDIDQIKQTAKGTSEQLADVQGDITNIQKDVNGLKQTTADNAGNIHTLQADSKTLKDNMQDIQGNISTLQKTATDVTSELQDHAGRISKVEQTASTLTNEFSDQQGHLNRVEQTANGTVQTLANQQGQINTIKTDTAGIHETITGQSNQIANLNVTLNGLNTKYDGVSGDLSKLSDKVVTNSTQIDQDKKLIALKADQTTVNNLSGEVSQTKAQLKVQADQISQKVSSSEYKMLKDKVNEMNGGGKNLLKGTRNFDSKYWYCSDSNHSALADNPVDSSVKEIHSYGDWASFRYNQTIQLDPNKNYMISADIAVYGNDGNGLYITAYGNLDGVARGLTNDVNLAGFPKQQNGEGFKRVYLPLNTHGKKLDTFRIEGHGNWYAGEGSVFISKITLYEGNTQQGWEDSSDDLIESIQKNSTAIDQTNQKISLKADQTTVDEIKNTATQNSSRLDVMAGEIKSKVTSTDVNNIVDKKGYATTSTVQSLITQKAGTINESITNLTSKVNKLKPGTVNILRNTDPTDDLIQGGITGDKWVCASAGNGKGSTINLALPLSAKRGFRITDNSNGNNRDFNQRPVGWDNDTYLFSIYARLNPGKSDTSVSGFIRSYSSKQNKEVFKQNFTVNSKNWKKFTFTIDATGFYTDDTASFAFGISGTGSIDFAEPMLVRGNQIGDWSPAPSDNATVTQIQSITASIDGVQSNVTNLKNDTLSRITQLSNTFQSKIGDAQIAINDLKDKTLWKSTDNIDLNSAVSQQKIFVKGGSNLPPGPYWWYVQVEPGYDSRIVQYAVSDQDNKHYSRQYNGAKWSAWSQGATESEITQLRDDINLRVKKGDLLSQINIDAGHTLIQSNKIYLAAGNVVFSDSAFIPSAAIENLDASKLTFYGSDNTYATMGASVAQYDDDKTKSTINLQYDGGIEIHASSQQGSILTMHDNTIRLASKSWGDNPNSYQYSGFYAAPNYSLMNTYHRDGTTSGVAIDDNQIKIYGSSKDQQLGALQADVGWYSINGKTGLLTGNQITLKSGNTQAVLTDNNININNTSDTNSKNYDVGIHIKGWAEMTGWFTCMGLTQTSLLSTKTRIEPLDTKVALDKIASADVRTYQFKTDVAKGKTKRHASVIIDDVHDVAEYHTPEEFISEDRKGRDDGDIVGYLMGAVQELKKQLDEVKEKI